MATVRISGPSPHTQPAENPEESEGESNASDVGERDEGIGVDELVVALEIAGSAWAQ